MAVTIIAVIVVIVIKLHYRDTKIIDILWLLLFN